jgi:hypothetical protein
VGLAVPVSWDASSDALAELAGAARQPDLLTDAQKLRRRTEDAWLQQERERARVPSCPCDHPEGWHFSWAEVAFMFAVVFALCLVGVLS